MKFNSKGVFLPKILTTTFNVRFSLLIASITPLNPENGPSVTLTVSSILNNYDKTDFMHLDNKKQVEALTGINVIATVAKNDKSIDITKENLIKLFTPKEG